MSRSSPGGTHGRDQRKYCGNERSSTPSTMLSAAIDSEAGMGGLDKTADDKADDLYINNC